MNYFIFVFNIIISNIFSKCCNYKRNKSKNDFLEDSKEKEDEKIFKNKIENSELDKLDEKYKKDPDFKYLLENLEDIEDIKKYIDIKNLYSDEIPDISDIKDITTDEILSFLKVNEAQNEIDKCTNINEKIKKLAEIIADDYKNNIFTFNNSNFLVPRSLIVHENNNCNLEAYFTYLESNPYYCKFFWLLNNLFENNNLTKYNLPITYEVCQFFKNAINNPNFNDKVNCLNISKTWYNNVEKLKNKMDSFLKKGIEDFLKVYHFGDFQDNFYSCYLIESIILELKDYYDFKNNNVKKINIFRYNAFTICADSGDYEDINKENCIDYLFKDNENNVITCYIFAAEEYHFYAIRNINGIFFNYDSYKYKDKPKPISNRDLIKLISNLIYSIKNFNGNYSNYNIKLQFCFTEKYI